MFFEGTPGAHNESHFGYIGVSPFAVLPSVLRHRPQHVADN